MPEALSGIASPDTKSIQAVGPTAKDSSVAQVTTSGPLDLQDMQSDPNLRTIDYQAADANQVRLCLSIKRQN